MDWKEGEGRYVIALQNAQHHRCIKQASTIVLIVSDSHELGSCACKWQQITRPCLFKEVNVRGTFLLPALL